MSGISACLQCHATWVHFITMGQGESAMEDNTMTFLSDVSDFESSAGSDVDQGDLPAPQRGQHSSGHPLPGYDSSTPSRMLPTQDIIDLTNICSGNEETESESDTSIIDLTGIDDSVESFSHSPPPYIKNFISPQWIKPESKFINSDLPEDRLSISDSSEEACWSCPNLSPGAKSFNCEDRSNTGSSTTANNSDMGSLENVFGDLFQQNRSSMGKQDDRIIYQVNSHNFLENPSVLHETNTPHPAPSHNDLINPRISEARSVLDSSPFLLAGSTSSLPAAHVAENQISAFVQDTTSRPTTVNKAWLYKLRYYKPPVHHFLSQQIKQDERGKQPIPSRKMNRVYSTMEESFPQATVHFLSDFVSENHYPPKDILCHVIRAILLEGEDPGIKCDAYTLLMKVQELHPANIHTVAWDWDLLKEVMTKKERPAYLLFLQYAVQTLHDDFHRSLRRRSLTNCLAKSMLSCDKKFGNIQDVINWLMEAVRNSCDLSPIEENECHSKLDNQREVFLFQRMISIAVEIDNSPAISSIRIADFTFSYLIDIRTRQQKEIFLNSLESHLLRAKILEFLFTHSCPGLTPPTLSLVNILCFIEHFKLIPEQQGSDTNWQRWDEMLHDICLLFFSYQRITSDNLLTRVTERIDDPVSQVSNHQLDLTKKDVETQLCTFERRISDGKKIPPAVLERIQMLKILLSTAIEGQP
ncbi:SUMO-interacting motif-containing protein 1 [Pelobates fuscus]|uniref:SUMO-interacting motif-containing protein 1 n=1 Tax=Pelobates fuscus TaxID=191477 RepID=UPI002FE4CBCA